MLRIAGQSLDPRLIVFDKDGTLIAFGDMWHVWFDRLMEAIAAQVPFDSATRLGFAGTLGYDPEAGTWDPMGPLTMASTSEIVLLMASQLYRYQGKTWDEAMTVVREAHQAARSTLSDMDLVKPIGDLRTALERFRNAGLLLALATTDDRLPTERALEKLGIASFFAATVCGDDGIPLKPAPDMALEICRRLRVDPREAIMIGDTVADLTMARSAGYGCAIAVTSGALSHDLLAPHADLVISDIHQIEVVARIESA